jgi:hypothetical protein
VLEQGSELAARIGATWFDDAIHAQRAQILRLKGDLAAADAVLRAMASGESLLFERSASAELAQLRAAQGRDEEAEAVWHELLHRPAGENVLLPARFKIQLAGFLTEHGRANEAAALIAEVRAAIAGTGAGLLESQLDAVEAVQSQRL